MRGPRTNTPSLIFYLKLVLDKTQHPVDTCLSQHERPKSISNIYEYQYRVLFTGMKNPNGSIVELQYERWFKYLFFVFQETEPNHA